ncbi:MAG: hypothetical protein H0V00_12140 [Chloroflexia bacterium]|nr:hypothetical protein [Chloroflexia bacterium]
MKRDEHLPLTTRMQAAIDEMKELISGRLPVVAFAVAEGDDPEGIYLIVTLDVDDMEEVTDLFISRMVDLQIEEDLPLFVIPERTPERTAALLARGAEERVSLLTP